MGFASSFGCPDYLEAPWFASALRDFRQPDWFTDKCGATLDVKPCPYSSIRTLANDLRIRLEDALIGYFSSYH